MGAEVINIAILPKAEMLVCFVLGVVLSWNVHPTSGQQQSNATCPNDKNLPGSSDISNMLQCYDVRVISPEALISMSLADPELRDALTSPNQTIRVYDLDVCSSFNTDTGTCYMDKMKFVLSQKNWPLLSSALSEFNKTARICGIGYGDSRCESPKYLISECGNITALTTDNRGQVLFNYRNTKDCEWYITVQDGKSIKFILNFIHIKYCKQECVCDYVKIYEIVDGNETEIETLCGRDGGKIIYTATNKAKVVYKTIGSNVGLGFKMRYESVDVYNKVLSKPIYMDSPEGQSSLEANNIQIITPTEKVYQWHVRVKETTRITGRWNSDSGCRVQTQVTIYEGNPSSHYIIQKEDIDGRSENTFKSNGFQVFVEVRISKSCAVFSTEFTLIYSSENIPYKTVTNAHGKVTYKAISLAEGSSATALSLSSNRNDMPVFDILQIDVTKGDFISLKFKSFNFSGPNVANCENEGIFIQDGKQRLGPYCGLMYYEDIFSLQNLLLQNNRNDPNYYPSIVSSTSKLVVIFYKYPAVHTISSTVELELSGTKCVGIYDIDSLDPYDFLNVTSEATGMAGGKKSLIAVHQKPSCFQFHFLPSLNPVKKTYNIEIMSKDVYTASKAISSHAFVSGCGPQQISSRDVDGGLNFRFDITMDCYYTSKGFIAHFSNIVTHSCIEKSYKATNLQTRVHDIFKGYPCGTLNLEMPNSHTYQFMAPIAMHTGHSFHFKITCLGRKPCRPLYSVCDFEEFSGPEERMYNVRGLRIWQVPFFWQTAWTFNTVLHCEMETQIPAQIQFKLLPASKPELTEEENENFECPETMLLASDLVAKYKRYCYSHHVTDHIVSTWTEAELACEAKGGTLLTITDQQEFDFIRHMLLTKWRFRFFSNNRIYIGLKGNTSSSHQWLDGNPLTISDWYRPLPSSMQYLPLSWFGEKSTFVSVKLEQPSNDPSTACVVMVLTNPVQSTNWIKLPCNYPYERSAYICKVPGKLKRPAPVVKIQNRPHFAGIKKQENGTSVLIPGTIDCPNGWNFRGNSCVRLLTSTGPIDKAIACEDAKDMCKERGGDLYQNEIESMFEYLKMWRHDYSYGNIWYGNCSIFHVSSPSSFTDIQWKKQIVISPDTTLHALCEKPPVTVTRSCGRQQFQCGTGTCISIQHVCDGIKDCLLGEDENNCTCSEQHFTCQDGTCVPVSKYCDFTADCPDNSDEQNCTFSSCSGGFKACDNGECIPEDKFYDFIPDCFDQSDLKGCTQNSSKCSSAFVCYSEKAIPLSHYKDMRPDCLGQTQEDEPLSEVETQRGRWFNPQRRYMMNYKPYCPEGNGTQSRCHDNHQSCFYRHEVCHFMNNYGCTDGSHLRYCETFECPNMFKCLNSYCIPYNKVCDGVRDCNQGTDEMNCNNYSCPGMFKCKKEGYCVDQSQVCDGVADCHETRDDEVLCDFLDCPGGCSCYGHALSCIDQALRVIPSSVRTLRSIIMAQNNLQLTDDMFTGYVYLAKLDISRNNIKTIPRNAFRDLRNLLSLDLRHNSIKRLMHGMFSGLQNLQHLLLQGNPIEYLGPDVFSGLETITYLNLNGHNINEIEDGAFKSLKAVTNITLSNNSLTSIRYGVFDGATHLEYLQIQGNDIYKMETNTFNKMRLHELHTDHYKFCCFAENVPKCTPEGDVYSSCKDLMANGILQVAVWVLGIAALVGNIIVIGWRILIKPKKADALLIINLALSDFLMGVYLVIIASADTYYRNVYILFADYWMNSILCKLAGFLATLSSEMSVFMLLVITADRLVAIVMPFSNKRLSLKVGGIVIALGWSVMIVAAAMPILGLPYFGQNYIKNGVCLLFNVTSGQTKGWEYTVFLFLLFNLAAFTFILVGYLVIYHQLDKSRRNAKREASDADKAVARRFALIVGTDFLCWVPVLVTWFLSIAGMQVHPGVSAWMVVFIMPLNAALNPYLYTFAALHQARKRQGVKKAGNISGITKSTSDGESKVSVQGRKIEMSDNCKL